MATWPITAVHTLPKKIWISSLRIHTSATQTGPCCPMNLSCGPLRSADLACCPHRPTDTTHYRTQRPICRDTCPSHLPHCLSVTACRQLRAPTLAPHHTPTPQYPTAACLPRIYITWVKSLILYMFITCRIMN